MTKPEPVEEALDVFALMWRNWRSLRHKKSKKLKSSIKNNGNMCEKYTKFGALSLEKVFEYVTILLRNKNRKLGYEKKISD